MFFPNNFSCCLKMATTNDIHDAKESTGATEIFFAEKVTLDTLPNYLRENSIEINSVAIYPSFLSFEFVICFNKLGNQLRIALPGSEDNYNLIKNQYQSDYDTINDKKIKNLQTTWAICNLIEYIHDSLNVNKITLTHMLPSWTNYGQSIIDHFETNNDNHNNNNSNVNYLKQCEITTSHNTTLACVVYNVEFVLNYYDRRLKSEIVGILGCGSIGYNSTLLLFSYFNENDYPIKLLLCDIETRKERIIKLKNEIVNLFNYKSDQIEIVVNRNGNVNKIFYQSSLIIGATSKGNVLDAWKLRPNTMVIDDSEPHCVHVQQVIKRFKSQNDIILTEAGMIYFFYNYHMSLCDQNNCIIYTKYTVVFRCCVSARKCQIYNW